MDYKNMTDSELAQVMINYINRVAHLQGMIGDFLYKENHGEIPAENIRQIYRQLKNELREDDAYLTKSRNQDGSNIYMYIFSPSIQEAIAWGFTVPVTGRINQEMYSAVEEAHYKLTKHYSLEEWGDMI